jgi:hypothetical protein
VFLFGADGKVDLLGSPPGICLLDIICMDGQVLAHVLAGGNDGKTKGRVEKRIPGSCRHYRSFARTAKFKGFGCYRR